MFWCSWTTTHWSFICRGHKKVEPSARDLTRTYFKLILSFMHLFFPIIYYLVSALVRFSDSRQDCYTAIICIIQFQYILAARQKGRGKKRRGKKKKYTWKFHVNQWGLRFPSFRRNIWLSIQRRRNIWSFSFMFFFSFLLLSRFNRMYEKLQYTLLACARTFFICLKV